MRSVIVVHPEFDRLWPFAADRFHERWAAQGPTEFIRLADADRRPVGAIIARPATVTRLVALGGLVTPACAATLSGLREAALEPAPGDDVVAALSASGVRLYRQPSEGFWGQSVAEFALALTLCGLRRIPQLHHAILADTTPWDYTPPGGVGRPRARGQQFGDAPGFANGTVAGKRVRVVGAGNIASRFASFAHMLGADVAAWDPYASEPGFHRAGARREWHLDRLVRDAEIFAPLIPLTAQTRGLVTAAHIDALPRGCLVVLATRALVCDMGALRRRVLADQLSLAADVFDVEPLPLDDPLLGRHNVVHTPHNAGRTIDANRQWADTLVEQFAPM
ncbi:MAG TPA: NAD(P)-dependent oxidoreductase [Thermomicrobiales bacterium]|jgi:phosphoglycerate dehydrogenase-like enzyme